MSFFLMPDPNEVIHLITETLELRPGTLVPETLLLGNLPELDSMAIVSLISACEEKYQITLDDDDITAENFESVGSFVSLLNSKIPA